MGLDVYLQRYDNFKEAKELERKYSIVENNIYKETFGDRKEISEDERKVLHKTLDKIRQDMFISEDGQAPSCESINISSSKHPEHLFKIGYFRSSYNGGGFNTIVGNAIGKELHYIFDPPESYDFVPDWEESKIRAEEMLKELKEYSENSPFTAWCADVREYPGKTNPTSEEEALKIFLQEYTKKDHPFGSYSNNVGHFFTKEPTEVYAAIPGKSRFMKDPCVYFISKHDYTWYIEAMEIVVEAIEYVLSQKDPENYGLIWSG